MPPALILSLEGEPPHPTPRPEILPVTNDHLGGVDCQDAFWVAEGVLKGWVCLALGPSQAAQVLPKDSEVGNGFS